MNLHQTAYTKLLRQAIDIHSIHPGLPPRQRVSGGAGKQRRSPGFPGAGTYRTVCTQQDLQLYDAGNSPSGHYG